jgi:hypothetical protein
VLLLQRQCWHCLHVGRGGACIAAQCAIVKLFILLLSYRAYPAVSSTACSTETRSTGIAVYVSRSPHTTALIAARLHIVLTSESMSAHWCALFRSCMQVTVLQRAFRAARDAGGKQPAERRLTLSTSFRGGSRSSRNAAAAAAAANSGAAATSAVAGATG